MTKVEIKAAASHTGIRMRRLLSILPGVIISLLWLMPVQAFALEQPNFGGNNASDYQPPTGNPQTNLPTSLQPTNTTLQPGTTSINQQALVQSGGLSVLTSPDKGATSTLPQTSGASPKSALPIWAIGGTLTLFAVAYILFKPEQQEQQPALQTTAVATKAEPAKATKTDKPKKAKKPAKKTTGKKKKPSRR